jgi:hypothetical protein
MQNLFEFINSADGVKYAASAALIGLGALYALNKFKATSHSSYPNEITFGDSSHVGKNLSEFLIGLANNHEKYLQLLKEAYDDECTLNLGKDKILILNSIDSVKKFSTQLNNPKSEPIGDRPKNFILGLVSNGYLGSFFRMNDDRLREVRKSSLNGLHKLIGGANSQEFESKVVDEINEFAEFLNKQCSSNEKGTGTLEQACTYMEQITANLIVLVGLGVRFPYELNQETAIKQQIGNMSNLLSSMNLIDMTRFKEKDQNASIENKNLMSFLGKHLKSVYDFLTSTYNTYKSNYDYESETLNTFTDYILLKQRDKLKEIKSLIKEDNYSDEDIIVQLFTLLMAGVNTTGFTLSWALYYLAQNPDIQSNIYNEILSKVGDNSFIYSKNRSELVYTEACISEILRLSSTQALIARATTEEIISGNSRIAAETPVFINMFAIHRDASYWKEPEKFNPKRWLEGDESNYKLISFKESYIPFGVAPRSCIGDNLSRLLLFLIVSNLVQRFQFSLARNTEKGSKLGVMRCPKNFNVNVNVRK